MSTRNGPRGGTPRRSPRISGRSETPGSRPLSPELNEQMTPRRGRRTLAVPSLASSSNIISIKQEDAPASYYLREESEPSYRSALLRGDQRSFNDSREANGSHSVSMSIFSSEGDLTDNYQQEEREAARIDAEQQQRPVSRATVTRRVSGQRKGRTSADNLPYRPNGDEEEDDDDDVGSPSRARRKGRNSNSISARLQGKIDNQTWMTGVKRKGRRKSVNGMPGELDDDDSRETNEDEDAEAASGKETRFDGVSDSEPVDDQDDIQEVALGNHILSTKQAQHPEGPSALTRLFSALASIFYNLAVGVWNGVRGLTGLSSLLKWGLGLLAVYLVSQLLNHGVSRPYLSSDDLPGHPSLGAENARLRSDLARLTSRLDSLSASIDSHISTSLSSVASSIRSEAEARHTSELSRLTASTKRSIARLAQEELKSIQESVSSSVELMLRDLDKKVHTQLASRADDTEGKFLARLEREVSKITRYANDEVNTRLGQAFDSTFLGEMIDSKLERFARDRTGKVDWMATTSGAWVSEVGTEHRGWRLNSVWNVGRFLAEGRRVPIGEPVKAITPGAGLDGGNCWMTGWGSLLQVNLAEPKVIEEVVVEHALPGMARTAPRRILVWGMVDEGDRQFYQQYRRSKAGSQEEYLRSVLPETHFRAIPQEYKDDAPLLLAHFEFKADGSTLQTFNLTEEAQVYPFGVHAVRWQFIDGSAKNPPICVHRVRVHGSDWPVFADKLAD
ncbi:Sad1/UNC-like, C-terminal [Kalmanozyma brasiliensis GHG001]|uniref:SUN domain-containing protein n=1 Tax=Kalmanozyma brasiliensis (strain GHG001) TaxID=1365824 RepID=V5EQN7_KALBG|nr:Sad1/UNC-like, C-terminal [Kalmanozyma brasiliensis GHG001]EST07460.1 Sad1/UNC-like, C-terminal [Kalmanozyma brasiliensis GHG001]